MVCLCVTEFTMHAFIGNHLNVGGPISNIITMFTHYGDPIVFKDTIICLYVQFQARHQEHLHKHEHLGAPELTRCQISQFFQEYSCWIRRTFP